MNDDDSGVNKPLVDNFEKFQEYTDKISENIPIVANYVEALKEYKGKMGTQQDTKSMRIRMNHEIGEANELIKQTLDLIQDLEDLKFKNKKDTDNKKKMLRRLNNSFEDYYEEFTKLIKEIHSNEKRFIDLQQSIFNASTMSEESANIPNGHKGSVYDSTIQKSSLIGDVNNDVENRNQAVIGSIHEDNDENEEVHIDDIVEENNNNMEEKLLVAENKEEEEEFHKSESIVRNQEENVVVEEKLQDDLIEKKEDKESIVGEKEEQHEETENVAVEQEKEKEEEVKENIEEEPVHRQEDVVEENNTNVKENIIIQETPIQEEENKEILKQEEEEVKENIEETPVQEEEIKENEEIVQEATIQGGEEVKEEIVHETPVQEKFEEHQEIIEEAVQEIKEEEPVIIETQQVNKESIRKEEVLNLDIVPEKNVSIVQENVAFKESIHEKKNGESVILKKSVREEIPRESIRMKSSIVREDVQALKQSIMEAKNNLDFYASIIQQRERQMSTVKRISSETNLLEGGREKDDEGNVGIVINDVSHSQTMDRVIEGGVEKKEKKSNTKRNVFIILAILLILGAVGAGVAFNMKK